METPGVKPEMSIRDRLYLDPIQKYKKYGNFPWKMLVHFLLLLFSSMQIVLIVVDNAGYSYNQSTVWNELFLVRGVSGDSTLLTYNYYVFGVGDLTNYFDRTIKHYYNINDHTIDTYKLYTDEAGNVQPMKMYVNYISNEAVRDLGYFYEYDITPYDLGPLTLVNVKNFLENVHSFYIEMKIRHELPEKVTLASNCFEWTIRQSFDYSLHGPINVKLDTDSTICHEAYSRYMATYAWLNVIVIVLAQVSLGIIWSYLISRAILIKHIQESEGQRDWQNLTFLEKAQFINPWVVVTFIGNLCQIFGSIMFFLVVYIPMRYFDIVVGLGSFCAWLNILRYLEDYRDAYTVVHTFKRAFPILWRYIVGVLPLFMAFCFLSMSLFWKTQYYNSTSGAMLANFALLNGDSVYMFFSGAVGVNFFWGFVYMYSFIVFFICGVHNLFIAIIGEGFVSLRKNPPKKLMPGGEDEGVETPLTPPSAQQLRSTSPKPTLNRIVYTGQKSQAAYRRILHTQTISVSTDPNDLANQEIERIKEEIKRKIARLKELASPPEDLEADVPALKAHLQEVLSGNRIKGLINRLVFEIKSES